MITESASLSICNTREGWNISECMIRVARKLKADKRILSSKILAEDVKLQKVVQLFEKEKFRRICPWNTKFVFVRIHGRKLQNQKYLRLSKWKEICIACRNGKGTEIVFSKFYELKLNCFTLLSPGTRSVC